MSLDSRDSLDVYIETYLCDLNCPRALTVWLLYSSNEHSQLVDLEFRPSDYNSAADARDSLAATKFLSKATFLNLSRDLRKAALDKFFEAELLCKATNRRLCESDGKLDRRTATIIQMMQRKISQILRPFTAEEFIDACDWGPGATVGIPRRLATQPEKFHSENGITDEAYDFVHTWFKAAYPNWDVQFKTGCGSKIVTVPKNAKTDRTIAIEPGINLWFQKGIGRLIRTRLKEHGIDLNKQDHNQARSRIASKFNNLATVDFSSASDTISRELVEILIPADWLLLLRAFRSSFGTLDGRPIYFEKFSSMGNGFTFELETLIFFSLAVAVCQSLNVSDRGVSVYGDDVVVPSSVYDEYARFARELGFEVNPSKSYSTGYFRESCGAYWWNGVDIKPVFQKEPLNGRSSLIKAANAIRRLAHRRCNHMACDSQLYRSWSYLVSLLGGKTPRISDGYGDLALIENIDGPHVTYQRPKFQNEGYLVRIWAVVAVQRELDHNGLRLYHLKRLVADRSIDQLASGNHIPLPGRTHLARKRLLIPRWYDLGPWV